MSGSPTICIQEKQINRILRKKLSKYFFPRSQIAINFYDVIIVSFLKTILCKSPSTVEILFPFYIFLSHIVIIINISLSNELDCVVILLLMGEENVFETGNTSHISWGREAPSMIRVAAEAGEFFFKSKKNKLFTSSCLKNVIYK